MRWIKQMTTDCASSRRFSLRPEITRAHKRKLGYLKRFILAIG
jgi:hypothetical protein